MQNTRPLSSAPILKVVKWQAIAIVFFVAISGSWSGLHGGVSALIGGLVNVCAVVVYWFVANIGLKSARGSGLWPLLRAEIVKLVVIAAQVALIFKMYAALVVPAFFVTFLITLLLWRVAFGVKTD